MRLHPPTTILAIIIGFLTVLAGFQMQDSGSDDERCRVAAAFIQSVFDDGVAFEGIKPIVLRPEYSNHGGLHEYLATGKARPSDRVNPLLPLYFKVEEGYGTNVADVCPDILDRFNRLVIEPDRDPVADAKGDWDRIYFSLSLPAVAKDKSIALIQGSYVYAGLAGGGFEVLMLKDSQGRWRVAYEDSTWIS